MNQQSKTDQRDDNVKKSGLDGMFSGGHSGPIALDNLKNTRDLGGMKTQSGFHIKPKALIRSGALSKASERDAEVLRVEYALQKVIDLRTAQEREEQPDPISLFPQTQFIDISILSVETLGITRSADKKNMQETLEKISDDPIGIMTSIYPKMVTEKESQKGFSQFFDELAGVKNGSVLWHCSAGKDRAGLATVFLLTVLGVPQDQVINDYLATNRYMEAGTQEILSALASYNLPAQIRESVQILNSTDIRFLQSALDIIDAEFGGMHSFLRNELDVTDEKAHALQEQYLIG